jgi:arylsulfatase A-like enzyme
MKQEGTLDDFIQGYLADVSQMDFNIGKIIRGIDATGLNPVIILVSDNGSSLGDHETVQKFTLWDEAGRVPLVVADPRGLSDHRCHDVVSLLDIAPTILQVASLPIPEHMDGRSLVPLFRNQLARRHAGALTSMLGSISLRTNVWRVTRYESGEQELFHIPSDPENAYNLAYEPQHSATLARMNDRLDKAFAAWER